MNTPSLLAAALLVALVSPAASADTITGQVVDSNGVGVAGVDIDVKNLGSGGTPTIFNDGTDANGFFVTTVPAGTYRVIFNPPPPPTTTHLIHEVEPVVISGTTAMGVIVLPPGVAMNGHVKDTGNLPVAGVNLDIIDRNTGDNLTVANDFTDVFGNFLMAVPAGPIEVRFDTKPVIGPKLAPTAQNHNLSASGAIPDTVLAPGFVLTGIVRDSGASPVEDADLDVYSSSTGTKLYTPGDNTSEFGVFSVIVPAGTFDLEICPDPDDMLVATDAEGLVVSANQNLGIFTLEDGELLTGTVRDFNGAVVTGADVDVWRSATGASVVTCNDNTDSNGRYSVIVPVGTLDVLFSPPNYNMGLGSDLHTNVAVSGTTGLNGVLPACALAFNYGAGTAGSGGIVPHLTTSGGVPSEGNPSWTIELENGLGGSLAFLVLSRDSASIPIFGGTVLVNISAALSTTIALPLGGPVGVPGAGSRSFSPGPLTGFGGFTGYAQFAVSDPGAPKKWAMSEGLQIDFCP